MNFELEKASDINIELLIKYKLNTILEYASKITDEEFFQIKEYIQYNIPKQIKNYKIIKNNNSIIGCLLVSKYEDGILLDEIYIEEEYRNKGIGTKIINNILNSNAIVYLWCYKENSKAIKLYKKLNFNVIEETESRYFMKYSKIQKN